MIVRLTDAQWSALYYWGRESPRQGNRGCDGANEAALLLLDVLLELVPAPKRTDELPPTWRSRPAGSARFEHSIALPATTRSPRTRALWAWGYNRGCFTVAESFRQLIALVVRAYPDLSLSRPLGVVRPECLAELARLISTDPS